MMADDRKSARGAAGGDTERQGGAVARVRLYLALLIVFHSLAIALSLFFTLRSAAQEYQTLALFTARSFFQQVVVTRRWNARHGGVYVPVTESTQPNPHLVDPLRDVVTTAGLKLTKLNPAYMTRLLSDVMNEERGMRLHMTSLKPLRPENAPDGWEREALESFARGVKERVAVIGSGDAVLYRYIAPLATEMSCLKCHAGQGYKLNDIRGGIGVTFPYQPFNEALAQHRRKSYLSHLLFFGFGLGFILILGHLLLQRVRDLQESSRRIRRLEGLLPICAGCKKIRVAGGDYRVQAAWEPIEIYIHNRTDAEFTHGMCPECARNFFGDVVKR
jgi:hypothetical protein